MSWFEDYANDLNRALIDAAKDPVFQQFMESSDIHLVNVDLGNGIQAQAQALSRASIRRVIERIFKRAREAGVNLKHLICSEEKFNLCAKLNLPLGELMRRLQDFLANEWVAGGLLVAGVIITAPAWAHVLAILSAVGLGYGALARLCRCKPTPKKFRVARRRGFQAG